MFHNLGARSQVPSRKTEGFGNKASGEAVAEETMEALVAGLHTGGWVLFGRFP